MASQMFWLLSYVSLGLALTLGNRPTSIHSSQQQQQQQKQQSTSSSSSSSQTQKSRQDHRFSRDPTIADVGNDLSPASAPEEELDNLRSYRYDEEPVELDDDLTKDWLARADRPWRDPSVIVRRREQQQQQLLDERRDKSINNINNNRNNNNNNNNNNRNGNDEEGVGEASTSTRENAFLDEFATAVLDTLYPRHRDIVVAPAKPAPNLRQSYETRRYEIENNEPLMGYAESLQQSPRTAGKKSSSRISSSSSTGQRDFPKTISRSPPPVMIYRTDQPENPAQTIGDKFFDMEKPNERVLLLQRSPGGSIDNSNARSSASDGDDWSNEPIEYSTRNRNEMKNRNYAYESLDGGTSGNGNAKPPGKRNQGGGGGGGRGRSSNPRGWTPAGQQSPAATSNAGASIASQFLLRSARGNRQYDVPQIECPASEDGMERFACPTPDRMGRYRCIDDHVLCDGFIDCPTAEDEDRQACMFYKTTKAHLDVLADALLRWARGR